MGVLSLEEDYSEISDIEEQINGLTSQMNKHIDGTKGASNDEDDLDDILNNLHSEINKDEEKGSPIKESLAKCVSEIWKKPLSKEKYMNRLKKYKIPNNVELNVQKCNPEVWTHMLSAKQKSTDLRLQKIQNALVKTTASVIGSVSELMSIDTANNDKKELANKLQASVKKAMDATTLLSGVHTYTNKVRKEFISNSSSSLRGIACNEESTKGKFLFGENVTKQIADYKNSIKTIQPSTSKNFSSSSKYPKGRKNGYKQHQQTQKSNFYKNNKKKKTNQKQ